ncbi:UDP-N-acetylglucosamine 3-dehydrogenase [Kitasatospora sp. MAA4]|uniref:Gfo/Idh/MocA family oxidoreductase n=1 Tax=Kitasatospora sp. MAA4 TaxID=3035093 RepID=UPI002475F1B7|nr:Gfo/Idh/MocA family oxidoreductase [Kitasatospora sp. MAA4]MDH6135202.1 UDP-N-acetylglucosamine 3-dehydrogenase [Kitasatospora sp. MAA4]
MSAATGAAAGPPLRAGLVGIGAMGRHHARVLAALPGVRLVGVVDPAGDPTGSAHGTPVFAELAGLLARGLDYAVVACPTGLHEEVGLRLAAHGVAALIEKPLAGSAVAAGRLVTAFESRGLVAGVGHVERFNPALRGLRARVAAGELGVLHQVVTRRQGPFPGRMVDVGVVQDLATHDLDLTRWITGAEYGRLSARTVRRSGGGHEDLAAVIGTLDDGTMVSHLVSRLSPVRERLVAVTGERGCLVADTLAGTLTFQADGTSTGCAVPGREPLVAEHERFRDAVAGGAGVTATVTLRDGLRAVELAEDVLAAARHGQEALIP